MLASLKWLVMRPCRHPELPQPRSSPPPLPLSSSSFRRAYSRTHLGRRLSRFPSGLFFSLGKFPLLHARVVPQSSTPTCSPHPPPQAAPCLSVFLPMVANACWYDWSFPLSLSCSPAAVFPPKHSSATSEPGRFVQKLEKCQKANLSFFDKVRFRNFFFDGSFCRRKFVSLSFVSVSRHRRLASFSSFFPNLENLFFSSCDHPSHMLASNSSFSLSLPSDFQLFVKQLRRSF